MRISIYLSLFIFLACDYRVQVGSPDASTIDASIPDASVPDAGQPDGSIVVTDCDPQRVLEGRDGCPSDALCESLGAQKYCETMRPCSPTQTCSVNPSGAVCNDGFIPDKQKICLEGLCLSERDCPSSWICFRVTSAQVLGACSSRGPGSACSKNEQCLSNSCNIFGFGFGVCD